MKLLAGLLLLLMLVFAGVQWNDPDGPLWAAIYAVPAILMTLVLIRPAWLATNWGRLTLGGILLVLLVSTFLFWPEQTDFWTRDVWWEEETAREGMGMMIALLVSAAALPVALRSRSRPDPERAAG